MKSTSLYRDIAARTGGDIYIGVVGPVRTGKSTFIKQFMESTVLPAITDEGELRRAKDELPQAAGGKTVMTTEPKFVPEDAIHITLEDGTKMRVRMVDSVGYVVPSALGQEENGEERLVHTPWSSEPMPFREAARIGTRKVITDHATVAMLVTTDGSFGEIPREDYTDAEESVAKALAESGIPYAVILNSATPEAEETVKLAYALEEKYNAPVALVNCRMLDSQDVGEIFELLLSEFPITALEVKLPPWCRILPDTHPYKSACLNAIKALADTSTKMGDLKKSVDAFLPNEVLDAVLLTEMHPENGTALLALKEAEGISHRVMSEIVGREIKDDAALFALLGELAETSRAYGHLKEALEAVEETGYGIVMPRADELVLDEPRVVKQAGGYGVRMRARARSIHMIRAEIETELSPTVGTEAETEELVKDLLSAFSENPTAIWDSHVFGKSLYELVGDGINAKLAHMPTEARAKLSETLERIVNEGSNGLICILL